MDDVTMTLHDLKDKVAAFVRERDWEQFHDSKNLAMAIAVEAAELMNELRWASTDESRTRALEAGVRSRLEEELADVLIFCVSLANRLDLDISEAIAKKMRANAQKYPAEKYRGRYET